MADRDKQIVPSSARWHELGRELGVAYDIEDDGEVKAQEAAVIDDTIYVLKSPRYRTVGLALNHHCDVMLVDGQHRMLTKLVFGTGAQVGQRFSPWTNAHECAVSLARKAVDYEFPILGQIVSASHDGYRVDLGGELHGFLPITAETQKAERAKRPRKRFFRVKHVDAKASDVVLDYWVGGRTKRHGDVSATPDDHIIATLIALGDSTDSVTTVLSAALRLWGDRIAKDASAAQVEAVAQSGARYFGTFASADIAVAAVETSREAEASSDYAVGALKVAEWMLAHKPDARRLAFIQVELASLLQRRGEDFEARLYAQTAARSALDVRAFGVARAAVDLLSGIDRRAQRA